MSVMVQVTGISLIVTGWDLILAQIELTFYTVVERVNTLYSKEL